MKGPWPRRSVDETNSFHVGSVRSWSSRLSRVWLVSIVARATVVPVALFAASALRNDDATVLALVALSGSGVLGTIIAFLFDATFAAGRPYSKRVFSVFLGTVMVITVAITTVVARRRPSRRPDHSPRLRCAPAYRRGPPESASQRRAFYALPGGRAPESKCAVVFLLLVTIATPKRLQSPSCSHS